MEMIGLGIGWGMGWLVFGLVIGTVLFLGSGLGIGIGGWARVSICGRVGYGMCALCVWEVLAYVRGGMCCDFGCVIGGTGLGRLVCGMWD